MKQIGVQSFQAMDFVTNRRRALQAAFDAERRRGVARRRACPDGLPSAYRWSKCCECFMRCRRRESFRVGTAFGAVRGAGTGPVRAAVRALVADFSSVFGVVGYVVGLCHLLDLLKFLSKRVGVRLRYLERARFLSCLRLGLEVLDVLALSLIERLDPLFIELRAPTAPAAWRATACLFWMGLWAGLR